MITNPKIHKKILKNLAKIKKKAFLKYAAYDFNFAYDKSGKVYLVGIDNVTNQTFNLIKPVFKFSKKPLPAELYGMDQQPFNFVNNHHFIDAINSDTGEQTLLRYNVIDQTLVNAQTNDLVDPAFYTDLEGYELDLTQYSGSLLDLSGDILPVEEQITDQEALEQQGEVNLSQEQDQLEQQPVDEQQTEQVDPNLNEQPTEEYNQNSTEQYYDQQQEGFDQQQQGYDDQQQAYDDQNAHYGYDEQQFTQQQDYVDDQQQYTQQQDYPDASQQYYDDQQQYDQGYDQQQGYEQQPDQDYDQTQQYDQGYDQQLDQAYDQTQYDDQQLDQLTDQLDASIEQVSDQAVEQQPVVADAVAQDQPAPVDEVLQEQPTKVAKPGPNKPSGPKQPQPGKKAAKFAIKKPEPKPEVVNNEPAESVVEKEDVVTPVNEVVDQPAKVTEVKKEQPTEVKKEEAVAKEEKEEIVEVKKEQPAEVKKEEASSDVVADDKIELTTEEPAKKKINLDDLQQISAEIKLPKFETPKLTEPKVDSEQKEEQAVKAESQQVDLIQAQIPTHEAKVHHVLPELEVDEDQEVELASSQSDDHYDLVEEEDDDFFADKLKFDNVESSDLLVKQKPVQVNQPVVQPVVAQQVPTPIQVQPQVVQQRIEVTKLEEPVEIKEDNTQSLKKLETLIDENKKIIDQFKQLKEEAKKSNSNINLEKVAKQLVDHLTNKLNEKTASLSKSEPSAAELNKLEQANQKVVQQLVHEQLKELVPPQPTNERLVKQPKEVASKPYFEESDDLLATVSNKPKQPTSELLDFLVQQVVDGEEDDLPPPASFDKRTNQNVRQKLDEINQVDPQAPNQPQFAQTQTLDQIEPQTPNQPHFVPPQSLNQVETPTQRLFLEPEIQVQPQALYTASREHEHAWARNHQEQSTSRIEREEMVNKLQREPLASPNRVAYYSNKDFNSSYQNLKEFDDRYHNQYDQRTVGINPQDPYYDQGYEQPDLYQDQQPYPQEQYLDQRYQQQPADPRYPQPQVDPRYPQEAYQEFNRQLPPNQEYGYYPPAYEARRDYEPYQPRRSSYEVRKPLAYEFNKQPAPRRYQQLPNRYNEFDQARQLGYPAHRGTLRAETDFLRFREGYGYDYDRPSTQYYRSNYDTYVREVKRPMRQMGMMEAAGGFRPMSYPPRALPPRRAPRPTYGVRRVSRMPSLAPRGYNQQPRVRRVPVSRGYW